MGYEEINPKEVRANPDQPRKYFDDEALNELAESIKEYGLIHPIRVKPIEPTENGKEYELVAGERRWRAYMMGLPDQKIPTFVEEIEPNRQQELSLIENVHREDLSPVETANAIKQIFEANGITESATKLASKIASIRQGKSSSNDLELIKDICEHKLRMSLQKVENYLPIVDLSEDVTNAEREKKEEERLSYYTLSRLASVEDSNLQKDVYHKIEPETTEEGTIERVSHSDASKLITAVKNVKSESVRKELLDRQSKLTPSDATYIDTNLETEEDRKRAIQRLKNDDSSRATVVVDVIKDEHERDRESVREIETGDEFECPVCGKKYNIIHEEPSGNHRFEEVIDGD